MRPREGWWVRPGIARLFRLAIRREDRAIAEADEEIALHLALRAEQLRHKGLSPAEARAEAERRFGALDDARGTLHKSATHRENRMRIQDWMDSVRQDLRYALRGLGRNPGFTATAVLCLALGVGANAATFSLFDELVMRPLPVHQPDRLVNFAAPGPRNGNDNCTEAGDCSQVVSYPMYRDLQERQEVFTGIAAHRGFAANVASPGGAEFAQGVLVSGTYFSVLGLRPALGRLIAPGDDENGQPARVAVITHDYWMTRLGGDPGVVGKELFINDNPMTIVGVAPRGFDGTTLGLKPIVFVPVTLNRLLNPWLGDDRILEDRRHYWLYLFARLKPGVSLEQARTAMQTVYRPILAELEAPHQQDMSAETLERFKARELVVTSGRRGQSSLMTQSRTPLILLFAITGLVVLIACANIANLLLARSATRTTEMAVRLSLGAGRSRLVFQMLVESCVLAIIGGAASLLVAYGTLELISSLIPPSGGVSRGASLDLGMNGTVLAFAALLSMGAGVAFGMFPALHSTRSGIMASIRDSAGHGSGARSASRFRSSLVTAQIALSMALLISAGLFVRSLRNISSVDLGLNADGVVTFAVAPVLNGYDRGRSLELYERIEADLAALPGVISVGAATTPVLTSSSSGGNVRVEGFERGPDTDANSRTNKVGPGYFATLRMPILAGREFTRADRRGAPKVAIVNEAFARKFKIGPNPVGRRIGIGGPEGPLNVEIVGLAKDAKYDEVKGAMPPIYFLPYAQEDDLGGLIFYARGSPRPLLRSVPEVIAKLDANLPVISLTEMPRQIETNTYMDRMVGVLSAAFALVATLLTAVGLYGVLAFTVAQRTREIGLRMALGADSARVRRMVMGQVGRMTVVGAIIGIAAAIAIGRYAQSLLFELEGHDPVTMVSAVVVLALVAGAAGFIPAWRASRVEPMRALRSE